MARIAVNILNPKIDAVTELPCPFCGADPWGVFGPNDEGDWWVECDTEGCGNWHHTPESDDRVTARQQVVAAWNRRK